VTVVSGADAMTTDLSYYLKRASDERTAALYARDPRARNAHREMAERYEERVREMTAHHERIYVPMVEHA
jgi:predicted nuclease with TOPRIM domain